MKGEWCKHYNGLTNKQCRAGVVYASVEASERDPVNGRRFPCFQDDRCADLCAQVAYPTPEEVAERERKVGETVKKYMSDLAANTCPFCGAAIERQKQVGRCVYAEPCGHRLYQGRVSATRRSEATHRQPSLMNEQTQQPPATRVVHVRKDEFDVYIGRKVQRAPEFTPVGWGNPFGPWNSSDPVGDFRADLLRDPVRLVRLPELRGKRLGCWCAPEGGLLGNLYGAVCHGQVLAALADMPAERVAELATEAQRAEPVAPQKPHSILKVISLWQPWATLIASGHKRIETRSWPPRGLKQGQLLAIHAAKRWTDEEQAICEDEPFARCLRDAEARGLWDFEHPPLGCVVAIARFSHFVSTSYDAPPSIARINFDQMSDEEYAFGNYSYGRYGWFFSEVRPLKPIPLAGKQSIFNWTPAADELHYLEPRNVLAAEDVMVRETGGGDA